MPIQPQVDCEYCLGVESVFMNFFACYFCPIAQLDQKILVIRWQEQSFFLYGTQF